MVVGTKHPVTQSEIGPVGVARHRCLVNFWGCIFRHYSYGLPDGVAEMFETSKNAAMMLFGTTKNPEADSSPVKRKDTQDELDSGAAQVRQHIGD